jgi:acetyltransferase
MTADDTRTRVLAALREIAPDADPAAIVPDRALRDQVDLDSMDWLNLLDVLGERLGVVLPAVRLGPKTTLDHLVAVAAGQRRAARRRAIRPPVKPRSVALRQRRLGNGRRVALRPIVAADALLEAAFVRELSMASRYKRFMSSLRELSPAKLKYFTDVDQVHHIALAATAVDGPAGSGGRPWVGVARCITDPSGDACEFAVSVADDWQGSGLAGVLMRALMQTARARGLKTMYGTVLASNRGMLGLARQLGFSVQRESEEPGVVRVQRAL